MEDIRQLPPPLPPRLDWFVQTQVDQLAQGGVPAWFHGTISRVDAEDLLESQPPGSFLIRVSHSHVGYTLSYKAPDCCRHFMVKLLDTGTFLIPGENKAHSSLDALVTFHQHHPLRPHKQLLTQPCGQKDPANVDYEDLLLYYNALTEEAASPVHGSWEHQSVPSCATAAPAEASPKPAPLHQPKVKEPSVEQHSMSVQEATSSCPAKVPLEEACQRLWKKLKMLPETGKRAQQQLRSHLSTVTFSSFWGDGQWDGSPQHTSDQAWPDNVCTDTCVATSLASPSQSQAPRDRAASSRKPLRSASCGEETPRPRVWHHVLKRAMSSQASKLEQKDLPEPHTLPEEYRLPPPFAPGYC